MSDDVPKKWVAANMPSQKNKVAVVTGANSGIGFYTALELARHGADVVLACRNRERGEAAVLKIQEEIKQTPDAGSVELRLLDVSSLASVHQFVDSFTASYDQLDLLINNAGILAVPYALTPDGYESQFATNHLGHFALTAKLFGMLKKSASARVVNVSSIAHRDAHVDLTQIMASRESYRAYEVYKQTKVYNLLFTHELNRRLETGGASNIVAVAAHPGFSETNIGNPFMENSNWVLRQLIKVLFYLPIMQTSDFGALPTLYAATMPGVKPNDYYGPDGVYALTGYPTKDEPINVSKSEQHARILWDESERLAKLRFEI